MCCLAPFSCAGTLSGKKFCTKLLFYGYTVPPGSPGGSTQRFHPEVPPDLFEVYLCSFGGSDKSYGELFREIVKFFN